MALIEIIAALVLIGLLLRLVLPATGPGTTPQRLRALAAAAATLLREARTAASRTDRPVAARFDAARRRLSAAGLALDVPGDVDASLTAGGRCPGRAGALAEVVFRPDGSNCGGVLRLARGPLVLRAQVNWADGRVDVVDGG